MADDRLTLSQWLRCLRVYLLTVSMAEDDVHCLRIFASLTRRFLIILRGVRLFYFLEVPSQEGPGGCVWCTRFLTGTFPKYHSFVPSFLELTASAWADRVRSVLLHNWVNGLGKVFPRMTSHIRAVSDLGFELFHSLFLFLKISFPRLCAWHCSTLCTLCTLLLKNFESGIFGLWALLLSVCVCTTGQVRTHLATKFTISYAMRSQPSEFIC